MAKYKIEVIKLLMKNGKMADYGTIHDEAAFNKEASVLLKEKYITVASKKDIEEAAVVAKEAAKTDDSEA